MIKNCLIIRNNKIIIKKIKNINNKVLINRIKINMYKIKLIQIKHKILYKKCRKI